MKIKKVVIIFYFYFINCFTFFLEMEGKLNKHNSFKNEDEDDMPKINPAISAVRKLISIIKNYSGF